MGLKTNFVFQDDQLILARTLASRFAGPSDCAFLVLHCKKAHKSTRGGTCFIKNQCLLMQKIKIVDLEGLSRRQ
jgi:hypothetical protein